MSMTDSLSERARWMGVAMLFCLYTLHSVDRYVIAVIIEPLRHAFKLTDTELGAIGGLAHAIAYSACVLPVGWLMDRTSRVKLLAFMLGIWSAFTAIGALATGFWFLFLMRMGVGAAESASSPGTQSLIASLFPVKRRASAMGVVFSGTAVGTGLVFAAGGMVAAKWGWPAVFLMAGVPGMILAVIMWYYMPEPHRNSGGGTVETALPMRQVITYVLKTPPILWISMGSTIAAMNVASIWVWITPILIRQHEMTLTQAGLIVGGSAGILKFSSGFLSGFLGDWIAKGRINKLWIVPSTAMALTAPISLGIALAPSPTVAIVLVMCLGLCLGTHYAAPKTVIMTVAPDNMRGSVASIEQLMVNLIGVAAGPIITGMISDRLGGANAVGMALAGTVSINIIAALCFWQGMRKLNSASIYQLEEEAAAKVAPVM